MRNRHQWTLCFAAVSLAVLMQASPASADTTTLKVYLLAGQSNMQGHAYTYYENGGNLWNIPTLEFLLDSTPTTATYLANMPASSFTFKEHLDPSWMNQRDDAWAVQYRSAVGGGTMQQVEPTLDTDQGSWATSIMPLSPGFGSSNTYSNFGPELGMGTRLGDALHSPLFLFKSNSDQNHEMNVARANAVATLNGEHSGSAVFFETNNMIGTNWGNNPSGAPFSTNWGYHFNAKAENLLEIGWRAGDLAIANGYTGTEVVPEPSTFALAALGLLGLLGWGWRRRKR